MGWGEVVSAGAGALSGMLGSDTDKVEAKDYYLPEAANLGRQAYGQAMGLETPQYYQGQQIADMNPMLSSALAGMGGYYGGAGGDLMNQQAQGAGMGLDAMNAGLDYTSQLQHQGAPVFQYDQGTYDTTMGNMMGGYQGMFDSGAQDIQRNFDWNMLPGLNMQNAMGGGQGATKMGQSTALGQALTGKNIQDFGLGLWNQANQMANQNAYGASTQNLASQNKLNDQVLGNYGRYAQLGSNMGESAFNMGRDALNMGAKAGTFQQAYNQSLIDADKAKWDFNQQAPWTAVGQKVNWVNQGRGGPPSNTGASPWEGALEGAQFGLGLYDAFSGGWDGSGGDGSGGGGSGGVGTLYGNDYGFMPKSLF